MRIAFAGLVLYGAAADRARRCPIFSKTPAFGIGGVAPFAIPAYPMTGFVSKDANFEARVRSSFARQNRHRDVRHSNGEIELRMPYAARVCATAWFYPRGYHHDGARTACGYAALLLMPDDAAVLTVEFKTSLIAPARGDYFLFRARVLKPGRTITVCDAQVFAVGGKEGETCRDHDRHLRALFGHEGIAHQSLIGSDRFRTAL
jgi:acyl-coenzyme A thioesterase PaaI-like protein